MGSIRNVPITTHSKTGTYTTRNPREIIKALRTRKEGLTGSEIDIIASKIPNIFTNAQGMIIEGANLEELSVLERFERGNSMFDANQVKWLAGSVAAAIGTGLFANYGNDPSMPQFVKQAYEATKLGPEVSNFLNTVNELAFFLKGGAYDNALAGLAFTASKGVALAKGIIPWRGDQIKWENAYAKKVQKGIAEGTHPFSEIGHVVGFGLRDPLMSSNVDLDGQPVSFTRALRHHFGNVLLTQRDGEYWRPRNQGIEFNDDKMFANLERLLADGTPRSEAMLPVIVSGAYKAGAMIINGQRGYELFEQRTVDSNDRGEFDISLASHVLRNAQLLRWLVYADAPPIKTALIIPQYLAPKQSISEGNETWKTTVDVNFRKPGDPPIDKVIVPELVFVEKLFQSMTQRSQLGSTLYVDVEGERDAEGKAVRFQTAWNQYCQSVGAENGRLISNPDIASEADNSLVMRTHNTHIDQSTRANREIHGHEFVFYSTTQRVDTLDHSSGGKRVPIMYKSDIGAKVLEALT